MYASWCICSWSVLCIWTLWPGLEGDMISSFGLLMMLLWKEKLKSPLYLSPLPDADLICPAERPHSWHATCVATTHHTGSNMTFIDYVLWSRVSSLQRAKLQCKDYCHLVFLDQNTLWLQCLPDAKGTSSRQHQAPGWSLTPHTCSSGFPSPFPSFCSPEGQKSKQQAASGWPRPSAELAIHKDLSAFL